MRTPIELGNLIHDALGIEHIYFQPPETVKLKYPCAIYHLNRYKQQHADDISYLNYKSYLITIVDKDPESDIPDKLLKLPMCTFDRYYTSDMLNHWVFSIYF